MRIKADFRGRLPLVDHGGDHGGTRRTAESTGKGRLGRLARTTTKLGTKTKMTERDTAGVEPTETEAGAGKNGLSDFAVEVHTVIPRVIETMLTGNIIGDAPQNSTPTKPLNKLGVAEVAQATHKPPQSGERITATRRSLRKRIVQ